MTEDGRVDWVDGVLRIRLDDADPEVGWSRKTMLTSALEPADVGPEQVALSGAILIDAATAAAGTPLTEGTYAVWLVSERLGLRQRRRLEMPQTTQATPAPWWVSASAPVVSRVDWSAPGGQLQLLVRDRQPWLAEQLSAAEDGTSPGSTVDLGVRLSGRLPEAPVAVTLSIGDRPVLAELRRGESPDSGVLRLPSTSVVPRGRYPALVAGALRFLAEVESSGRELQWRPAGTVASLTGLS